MKHTMYLIFCLGILCGTNTATGAEFTDSVRFFFQEDLFVVPDMPDTLLEYGDPSWAMARLLAGRYAPAGPISPEEMFIRDPAPLRIPNPFAKTGRRSTEMLQRTRSCLGQQGLAYELSYPEDFIEATQVAAAHISKGYPVVALHPRPYVLFGFDYRESEPLWFVARFSPKGIVELITVNAWREEWWLWEPDPTSVILIKITGRDDRATQIRSPENVFADLLTSAKTDTATNTTSYIRPILEMIDSLSEASAPPAIVSPSEDPADPLYFRRAEIQRLRLKTYLESLMPMAPDSSVQQNLRLAVYSAGKSAAEFVAARNDLYGETTDSADTSSVIVRINRRWVEHHLDAADHLSEVVRWDRQMLAALKEIESIDRPFRK